MMKIKIQFAISLLLLFMIVGNANAQTPYAISIDEQTGSRIYKGGINKYTLQNDSTFSWYARSAQDYTPDTVLINTRERKKEGLHFIWNHRKMGC